MTEPRLAGKFSHYCTLQPAALTIPPSYRDGTYEGLSTLRREMDLLGGNGTENVPFRRIPNVLNCSMWVFGFFYVYVVSVYLPMKVKRSFVAENELFSEMSSSELFHFGTELQTVDFVVG